MRQQAKILVVQALHTINVLNPIWAVGSNAHAAHRGMALRKWMNLSLPDQVTKLGAFAIDVNIIQAD